ncbi:MAG: hypothetical protein PHH26_03220 [Candidatus Thermoplasmatota archaeon]|nr:hypothetical protein [Candidatus Thermoplasmatota archaeon]
MKSILAVFAIGLLLATAFSGCVGGDKGTGDTGTGDGTGNGGTGDGTGNETGNETGGNATGNATLPDNYHQEYSDTIGYEDLSWTVHDFPVQAGAKKVVVHIIPTFTVPVSAPGQGFVGGMDVTILDSKGNELVSNELVNGEITYEFGSDKIVKFGKWKLEMFPEDPSVTVQSIIDVLYS